MKQNDTIIKKMVENTDKGIEKAEIAAKEALKAAAAEIALYEAAKEAEDKEVPEGELHCDDAINKGAITIEGPYGMSMKLKLRDAGAPEIKAIIGELHGMLLAEKDAGTSFAERGHTVQEWLDDAKKVWAIKYADDASLLNAVDGAKIKAKEAWDELVELCESRVALLGMLSDEYKAEIIEAMQIAEMMKNIPGIADGVTAPAIDLKDYEIPEEIKELYAKVLAPVAHHDCCCYDDCDCGEYMDDEDEDECPW